MKFLGQAVLGSLLSFLSLPQANAASTSAAARASKVPTLAAKNIVIVHGAFTDGSGWEEVYHKLSRDGFRVTVVQNSTASLSSDVSTTLNAIAKQDGPVVLVGHSYGGAVITQAGTDTKVKSLVYVAAYVPDVGEAVGDLLAQADKSAAAPPIMIDGKLGIALIDPAKFHEAFAADISDLRAEFMAASQLPLGLAAVSEKLTSAAWKTKPSSYIVATQDQMIPPNDERKFALRAKSVNTVEIKSSHAVFISHANEVARVIEAAAKN